MIGDWRTKHGHCSAALAAGKECTREYKTWRSMKERCTNPSNAGYYRYGGRGISVCAKWLESFENFYADMGDKPLGKSIDRIDNDGNYEPGNCRWATPKEQSNNQRKRKADTVCSRGHSCPNGASKCRECHQAVEKQSRQRRKALGIVKLRDLAPGQREAFKRAQSSGIIDQ